jgi:hypothetical protein
MLEVLKNRLAQIARLAVETSRLAQEELEKIKLSEDERNIRYQMCIECEYFFSSTTTCKKCGCFMIGKTYMPSASCPIGKWPSIPIIRK